MWAVSKVWLALLPIVWWRFVQREPIRVSKPSRRGMVVALVSGCAGAACVWLAPFMLPNPVDPVPLRALANEAGFATRGNYLLIAAYICTANALLEEYVWRWFTFVQCEAVFGRIVAVFACGLFFTIHHAIVLARYCDPAMVVLGSLGVFVGGVTWSSLYLRYRSVWPGFVSHVLVDVAIFAVGWKVLFS